MLSSINDEAIHKYWEWYKKNSSTSTDRMIATTTKPALEKNLKKIIENYFTSKQWKDDANQFFEAKLPTSLHQKQQQSLEALYDKKNLLKIEMIYFLKQGKP